jgi:hypothetical protein
MTKKRISFTQLKMLSFCGEQYRRRYVENDRIPPGIALLVGRGVDDSVNADLSEKIATGGLLPDEAIPDIARTAFDRAKGSGEIKLTEDEAEDGLEKTLGGAVDKTVRLATLHHAALAPTLAPTHVQRSYTIQLDGYPVDLTGVMDIQEGLAAVRDTKTSGKTPPANVAERDLQLTGYALAVLAIDGALPEAVTLDYLIDLKTPKAQVFASARSRDDLAVFLRRVEAAVRALEAGAFVPASPNEPLCSPRWCGYHSTCPYVRQPATIAVP